MEIAAIPFASHDEESARRVANEVALDLETRILEGCKQGGQLLLARAYHYVARRAILAQILAAVRDADVNDPSRPLFIANDQDIAHLGIGAVNNEHWFGERTTEADVGARTEVKFRVGHTYIFEPSIGAVRVLEYESTHAKLVLDDDMNAEGTLNRHVSGALILNGLAEDVYIKEKVEDKEKDMLVVLAETAMEVGMSAALSHLNCFVEIRAVQVKKDKVWLAFEKLPGRSLEVLLDTMDRVKRRASECEVLGAVLLLLDAYCKLNAAGYQQRDLKSANLWLYEQQGCPLSVRVIDSDACLKAGHMTDARDKGISNEAFITQGFEGNLIDLGGTKNMCSMYCANVDLKSKQCVPGEQAVVFSLSEITLRMTGKEEVCYYLHSKSTWREILENTVLCGEDCFSEDEAEAKVSEVDEIAGRGKKPSYSAEFRRLVVGMRRRTFTQGGVDAYLDLHTTRALCTDFVTRVLKTTEQACKNAFAALVSEMDAVNTEVGVAADEEAAEEEDWAVLTAEEADKYLVCPLHNQVESDQGVRIAIAGLALRERLPLLPASKDSDMEIYIKAPQIKLGRGAVATAAWWRRIPATRLILDEIQGRCGCDVHYWIGEAMDEVASDRALRVNGDVLCAYLSVQRAALFGSPQGDSWPNIRLYPYCEKMASCVVAKLVDYRDSLEVNEFRKKRKAGSLETTERFCDEDVEEQCTSESKRLRRDEEVETP